MGEPSDMTAFKDAALEAETVRYFTEDAARNDPYPFYKRLRETAPVYYSPTMDMWIASSYEAVNRVLQSDLSYTPRSHHAFDESSVTGSTRKLLYTTTFLFLNPPEHTRYRNFVKKTLSGTNSELWRPAIARWIDQLQEKLAGERQFDFVSRIGHPIPFGVICDVIGLPYEDVPMLRRFVRGFLALFAPDVSPEADVAADREFAEFGDYLRPHLEDRLAGRVQRDDVFAELIGFMQTDELKFEQVGLLMLMLLVGGHETTGGLLGSAVYHLLCNRDQWEALVADPELANQAVEETLRFETPARQLQPKFLNRDLELQGVTIPQGQRVIPILAAAHRDPEKFPDPDRFDIHRNAKLNIAFGLGRHFCIGASFARVEGQEFLKGFPQRFPKIRLAGDVAWEPGIMLRGPSRLPLQI